MPGPPDQPGDQPANEPGDIGSWRPGASLERLRLRAAVLQRIRAFFATRGVLEVETPVIAHHTVTDPHLHSLETRFTGPGAPGGTRLFLQTSPEFAMKRLLCAGAGPIYQLARVFRDGERGRLHNPEFTLLEWYRPGLDHHGLMDEVEDLVGALIGLTARFERLTYAEAFRLRLGRDPLHASISELRDCAMSHGLDPAVGIDSTPSGTGDDAHSDGLDRDGWLDLLMSHLVQPMLGIERPVFIHDYPASQAALARLHGTDPPVAERFELFYRGVELANGYHELGDAAEQRTRFDRDNARRRNAGLPAMPPDERLLAALAHGLPPCAGVALGLDRLVMLAAGATDIREVMAFTTDSA